MLSACSGIMKGMIQQGGDLVEFQYEGGGFGYGEILTTLPDGEKFEGKFVEESVNNCFCPGLGFQKTHGNKPGDVESNLGIFDAVLFGNKGHTMKCWFRLADSKIGLSGGGIGTCQVSDDRIIDLQF